MKLITDTLREIRKGAVVDQASVKLADLVCAVTEHGKAGSLTIKLDVKPQEGDRGLVTVTASLKVVRPEAGIPDAIFYVDGEGGLHRNDPDQGDFIRDAGKLSGGVREVG